MLGIIAIILIIVNVIQFIYWSRLHNDLMDKLMSKNFAEYSNVKNFPKILEKTEAKNKMNDEELQKINDEVLSELNGIFKK